MKSMNYYEFMRILIKILVQVDKKMYAFFLVKSRNLIILKENTTITKPLQTNINED